MRHGRTILIPALILGTLIFPALTIAPVRAQEKADEGPANEKAQKTYKEALGYLQRRMKDAALDGFKKADKQDDGHCRACQKQMIRYGMELGEWKVAESGAEEMVAQAQGDKNIALAHYQLGVVLMNEGKDKPAQETK